MYEYKIYLNTIEKVKKYIGLIDSCPIPLYIKSGRYIIDGKSILGIFSLNLSEPLELSFDTTNENDNEIIDYYIKQIEEFIME